MTLVVKLRGVDVYVHWTVLVVGILMIYAASRQPGVALAAGLSWLALMLLHESGHMVAAQRKHCQVLSIELYPIFGLCRFEIPWSRYDHCVIAWGGVIAQLLVAIPLMAGVELFGYSRFNPVNVALFIFGQYSLVVAVFNLLPVRGLDGAMAWRIIPEAIKRLRGQKAKKASAGR
jgi:Zn-dependent protease